MNKEAPRITAGLAEAIPQANATLPFRITSIERVEHGFRRAIATVAIVGLGSLDVDYFVPTDKPASVAARGIKASYSGRYERILKIDRAFAAALLEAIEARLEYEDRRRA